MDTLTWFQENLLTLTPDRFAEQALTLFRWQATQNEIYRRYLQCLSIDPQSIRQVSEIPFLPIDFFKRHPVLSVHNQAVETVFESSGTTGQVRSRHYVQSLSFYHRVCQHIFEARFGSLSSYHILALLPSYLERKNASLVSMVDYFIRESASDYSGFYLDDYEKLLQTIHRAQSTGRRVLLVGVTFALLHLAETYAPDLHSVRVLETGGMKGMRKEITREEVYDILRKQTGVREIYSEYGMTELLSQAYTTDPGVFQPPPWMRVAIREVNDPFTLAGEHKFGGINVVDLANIHSCAFIETMDRGKVDANQHFEVLGRLDNSDVRGCNTMIDL